MNGTLVMGPRVASCFLPILWLLVTQAALRSTPLSVLPTKVLQIVAKVSERSVRRRPFQQVQVQTPPATFPAARSRPLSCPPSEDHMATPVTESKVAKFKKAMKAMKRQD